MSKNGIIKSVSIIMVCTIAFKILGFIREVLLSFFFGTSNIADAYLVSQTIPSVVFEFVGAGVTACFIPIYLKIKNREDGEAANRFVNTITTLTLVFSLIIIAIVIIFAYPVVKVFASGFTGETLSLTIGFTRIGIWSLIFSTFIFIYGAYLQANENFEALSISGIIVGAGTLLAIVLGATVNIWLISIVSVVAVGLRLILIFPETKKTGLHTKVDFDWKNKYVLEYFSLMVPVIVGTSINDLNTLVDRTVASNMAVGGIAALSYANSMLQLAIGGIVQPISTVIFPKLSSKINCNADKDAIVMLERTNRALQFFLLPITVGLLLYSGAIVDLLFGRGAFDSNSLKMTSEALRIYGISLCFIGTREILTKYFYSKGDSKIPMVNSSIGLVINIILNIVLSRIFGLNGLALATTIAAIVTTLLLYMNLVRDSSINNIIVLKDYIKIIVNCIIMGILSYIFFNALGNNKYTIVIVVLFAAILYFGLSLTTKIEILNGVTKIIKDRKKL